MKLDWSEGERVELKELIDEKMNMLIDERIKKLFDESLKKLIDERVIEIEEYVMVEGAFGQGGDGSRWIRSIDEREN